MPEKLLSLCDEARPRWKKVALVFIAVFGTLWTFVEPLNLFNLGSKIWAILGAYGYLALLASAATISVALEAARLLYCYSRIQNEVITFLHQSWPVRIIRTTDALIEENVSIVEEAERMLVTTGSRSRDACYLQTIEQKLASNPDIVYYRVLHGPPHHGIFRQHLLNLLKVRDPYDRRHGYQTLFIGLFEDHLYEPEKFVCANESRALIVLPSLTGIGNYDAALVLCAQEDVRGIIQYVRELYCASVPVETPEALERLSVLRGPDTLARGA